jgi:hypothetical protein
MNQKREEKMEQEKKNSNLNEQVSLVCVFFLNIKE